MKKRAYSLPEVLITLLIVAVLVTIMMPVLNKAKPDENELMHKKATFIVERVVNELFTDEFLYPNNATYTGFGNLAPVTVNGTSHAGNSKFCSLFASRINKAAGTGVNCLPNQKSVTSVEGIDWYLPISNFQTRQIIKVDVNGDKRPNCSYDAVTCKRPDQFLYQVQPGIKRMANTAVNFDKTPAPPVKPLMPGEPGGDFNDPRTAQKWYSISCRVFGNGTVYGVGSNKPNGHYQLVAIPALGYKGDWFTKNVTVNNADVTDCSVTFTPFSCAIPGACPTPDGGTVNPPAPEPTPEEKTYCINITMTGEKDKCAYAGNGCKKSPGKYVVSASGKDDYKPSWTQQEVTIVDKDINLTVDCAKEDEEKCFAITPTGDTENCPVTLPAGTCKADNKKYTVGTYDYTVTPKEGYTFGEGDTASADAQKKQVMVVDKDVEVPIKCNKGGDLPPEVNIYITDSFVGARSGGTTYYHTYKYYYQQKRSVSISEQAAKDLDLKVSITGSYSGFEEICVPYNFAGVCSTHTITLKENDIEAKFSQPIKQEITPKTSATWDAIAEFGTGKGGYTDHFIQSNFDKYTITINGKTLVANQSYPLGAFTAEVKDGSTTYKIHFVPVDKYMVRVYDLNGKNNSYLNSYTTYGQAWTSYGSFWSLAQHVVYKGESIKISSPVKVTLEKEPDEPYYLSGIYYNNYMKCVGADTGYTIDCSFTIDGGNSFPSITPITSVYRQHISGGGGGGGGGNTPTKYATITLNEDYTPNNLGTNCTDGWYNYKVKSSDNNIVTVTIQGSGSVCTYNASNGQLAGCYGDASVNQTANTVKYRNDYNCYINNGSQYENLEWTTKPSCSINIFGKTLSCESGTKSTINNTIYTVSKISTGGSPSPPVQTTYRLRARFLLPEQSPGVFSVRLDPVDTVPERVTVTFNVKGKYRKASDNKIYTFSKEISVSVPGSDYVSNARVDGENDVITELTSMTVVDITSLTGKGKYTVSTEISDWR